MTSALFFLLLFVVMEHLPLHNAASAGNILTLQQLLSSSTVDVNEREKDDNAVFPSNFTLLSPNSLLCSIIICTLLKNRWFGRLTESGDEKKEIYRNMCG
jgi:hypothetical protein